jgi:diguanylate cyclase (GGDEF)-like protein
LSLLQNRAMPANLIQQALPPLARRGLLALAMLWPAQIRHLLVLILLLLATVFQPAIAGAPALTLDTDKRANLLDPSLEFVQDSTVGLTVEQIERLAADHFASADRSKPQPIEGGALWLRFQATVTNPAYQWRLKVPMPGVDEVRFYFRNSANQWVKQEAGDTRKMESWPLQGRYPVFMLNHEVDRPTYYYLEIRNPRVPFSALPGVLSDGQLIIAQQKEHILLGIYFGLAVLVIALALVNAVLYRDTGFGSYAVYMLLLAGAQGASTGVAGLYWLPSAPALNNVSALLLPVATAAASIGFVRSVITPRRFVRALDWFTLGLMGALPLIGLLDLVSPTVESFAMINTLIGASLAVLLMVVGVSLVEGDRHARWIALGFLPMLLATLFPLLRNFGLISSGYFTEYSMMLASSVEAPILFFGLLRRVAQRREPTSRATSLRTTDPLTGLFSTSALVSKLRRALGTAGRYPQPFALLVINVTNLAALQERHGRETGDRAMVMAAARIRAVARLTDTVARVGDNQFALLVQGPVDASEANNLATKILASGLRPSNELPDAEPLRFHIAVGHLGESPEAGRGDASACLEGMRQSANDLNNGSRKAIRLIRL